MAMGLYCYKLHYPPIQIARTSAYPLTVSGHKLRFLKLPSLIIVSATAKEYDSPL